MRGWWIPVVAVLAACSDDSRTGPGNGLEAPTSLSSTSLDGAIALVWSDNPFLSDPGNFQNYRVYSTSFDIDPPTSCGSSWKLEGTTVAPEFLVGALTNGVPRCFSVTAVSVDGVESDRSPLRGDTPRPDSRNIALTTFQADPATSGFRFWEDLNGDGIAQAGELGLVRSGNSAGIDFAVSDAGGSIFLDPVRIGTGVEFYDDVNPVEDLTSIDFAPDQTYRTTDIEALTGFGYVFQTDGGDGSPRYAALRITHVGQTLVILDWAFQPDPGNPELVVSGTKR